jgi:uncharacterized protein (TIGR04222 family)
MRGSNVKRRTPYLVATCLLLFAVSQTAAAKSLEIQSFDASIEVDASGEIRVEERIAVAFRGCWNGIFRDIPDVYTYPSGVRGTIRLTVDAIEDGNAKPLEHWESRRAGCVRVKIRVPGACDAVRNVVIRYHAENVIRYSEGTEVSFGAHDQLFWNVTGNGWQMPIAQATAEVRLPPEVPSESIHAVAYTGASGARGSDFEIARPDDNRIRFETTRELGAHSGLTIVVGFEPGHVRHPSFLQKVSWFAGANWFVGLPFLLLLLWLGIWWRHGRDSLKNHTIIPEWEPPLDLRPTEVGVLVDDRMDQRDLTASIVDLAVRGVITIRESESTGSGKRDFDLLLHEQAIDGAELETFEEALIDGLFGGQTEVSLSSLDRKFHSKLGRIYRKVLDDLVVKGLFRGRPDRVRVTWVLLTLAAVVACAVVGGIAGPTLPFWMALVVCAPPMFVLGWKMPQRTSLGLEALAHIKGMEQYLVTAEKDRMEQLPLSQVERLLPYAIALDLHQRWTEIFSVLFERPPQWYVASQGSWTPHVFGSVIADMNHSVVSNLYSVPRTSSSGGSGWSGGSGFSGGGSSGGGFGGGGGGGW